MSNSPNNTLIIFTRFPRPGKTKTRLAQELGFEAAADCQRQMTEYIVHKARRFCRSQPVDLQIHYDDATPAAMAAWLGNDLDYHPQSGSDIGQRMAKSFAYDRGRTAAAGFKSKNTRVVLIGSDCPDISTTIMTAGFQALEQDDLVLGPARDGGYYLIGMRTPHPELFSDILWGSGQVMAQTLAIAAARNLTVKQLDTLHDIDRPTDLAYFRNYTRP